MNEAVQKLPFWDNLSDKEQAACAASAVVSDYPAGSYLFGDCDSKSCLGMFHILSGEIRAFILSDEGREITMFRLGAGEDCVLSAACVLSQITFETQINVTRDAKILVIPSSIYGRLMEDNIYVRSFTYELATERFSTVMWVMQQIIFYGYDKRLAGFLLSVYEKTGSGQINMTQGEIAEETNSAREVVARMLKQFSSEGLIESRRGQILLKDFEGLKRLVR